MARAMNTAIISARTIRSVHVFSILGFFSFFFIKLNSIMIAIFLRFDKYNVGLFSRLLGMIVWERRMVIFKEEFF